MNTKRRRAFVTGIYGQDGSYLAEYLLSLGYDILGLARLGDGVENVVGNTDKGTLQVCIGDISDIHSYESIFESFRPDEVYNLAAISDLKTARENPELTHRVNFIGPKNLTEKVVLLNPHVKIFHALSSRILSPDEHGVIAETSELAIPQNAYDEAKRAMYEKVILPYREEGYFITSGFLCNHESPRRGDRFVTGKIARDVAKIIKGDDITLRIGNVDAKRDWSFAGDFVQGMHAALQIDEPADFVFASGELHSVKEFIELAFAVGGITIRWEGEGMSTRGYNLDGALKVMVSEEFYQPETGFVQGDIRKYTSRIGKLQHTSFHSLVLMMVQSELEKL